MRLCDRHKRQDCERCKELDVTRPVTGVTRPVTRAIGVTPPVTPHWTRIDLSEIPTSAIKAELHRRAKSGAARVRAHRARRAEVR